MMTEFPIAAVWVMRVVGVVYAVAAIVALRLKNWGAGRYVPTASVLVIVLPGLLHFVPGLRSIGWALYIVALIACPILVLLTLCLSWAGRRLTERTLQVTSSVILLCGCYFILRGVR